MNDDWRLRINTGDRARAGELSEELKAHALEDDGARSIHDRVIVSVDDTEVFCYAGTLEQAQETQAAIERLVANHGWSLDFELDHWHPTAERWEDSDVPLPETDAELAEEMRERIAQERADSQRQGYPEFEVRVQCATRGEAAELAEHLRGEGVDVVHRWSAVLIGAADEASAEQLAQRLRGEAPSGSAITVEGNLRAIYDERPWRPFSVFGGLAG
ncbi:MAG: hypothetical protein M3016_08735 [Actinomycetota bacterium]|nr:hypothetical protein [Actinomycetota bacterium]